MTSYYVWVEDGGEKPDSPNISAGTPYGAATVYGEAIWADWDYPETIDVRVSGPGYEGLWTLDFEPSWRAYRCG